jgi:hypothetical protein
MRRLTVLLIAAILFAPATKILLSDLFLARIAAEQSPEDQKRVKLIIWSNIDRARQQDFQISYLSGLPTQADNGRAMSLAPSGKSIAEEFPTCPDYVVHADAIGPEADANFTTREAIPVKFPMRLQLGEDRWNVAYASKLTIVQLALLDACMWGTPFRKQCRSWIKKREPGSDEIADLLIESRFMRRETGGICWQIPEFRYSTAP